MSDQYEISTDRRCLDVSLIYDFLRASYWAQGIPREVLERSIANSLCFGAYHDGHQVAFARVITDYATFAYIADVFVVQEHRSRGAAKLLLRDILAHPDLQGLRRVMLATRDAHGLYRQFGFEPLAHPEHMMSIHHPDVYRNREIGLMRQPQKNAKTGLAKRRGQDYCLPPFGRRRKRRAALICVARRRHERDFIMAVRIRLKRVGAKNAPYFRIVVADSRSPRDGKFIEEIGSYQPLKKGDNYKMDMERAKYWVSKGAQPSDTVASFIKKLNKAAVAV